MTSQELLRQATVHGIRFTVPRGNARLIRHKAKMIRTSESLYRELNMRFGKLYEIPSQSAPKFLWFQSQIMAQK